MEFKHAWEFFSYCRNLYIELLEEQYPDVIQSSCFQDCYIKSLQSLKVGKYFLKPNTNEYYNLTDVDIEISKKNDRLLFIEDMKNSKDVFKFILLNSASYIPESKGLYWRKVPFWTSKRKEWIKVNNITE